MYNRKYTRILISTAAISSLLLSGCGSSNTKVNMQTYETTKAYETAKTTGTKNQSLAATEASSSNEDNNSASSLSGNEEKLQTNEDQEKETKSASETIETPSENVKPSKASVPIPTGKDVQIIDGCTYINGILVVNKTYSLPEDYNPGDLTSEVYAAFNEMKEDAANYPDDNGNPIDLFVYSGFRSYDYQDRIYKRCVEVFGQEYTDASSARAGHSEHQTGLAIDINSIEDSFAFTAEGRWLEEHAHEYGFIIRYPAGKESITGYQYEPWHVRYLGREIAQSVHDSGLCLEEYLGITSEYAD